MSNYLVTDTELISVADAIRSKGGTVADLEWPAGYISAINAIPTGGSSVTIVDWATGTDEEIAAMIDAAHAGLIDLQQDGGWAVGDVRSIEISAFTANGVSFAQQTIDIVITSFADYNQCGNVLQFDFKDTLNETVPMYNNNNNEYAQSDTHLHYLPSLATALPGFLKDRLIEYDVYVSAGNQSTNIVTLQTKLALRAEIELFNTTNRSIPGEGSYVSYYDSNNKRKKPGGHGQSNGAYWTRSPRKDNNWSYVKVYYDGTSGDDSAMLRYRLAPFGCI